ncbi:MAG: hypothetical protein PSY14_09855 [bacterium]|nr:hypothetical protein [bacterium]
MDSPAAITDEDIQRIVATTTMADFRAAIAPWQDDGGARKKMVQKLHGGIDDFFTWQKHEALRLYRELEGAEPSVATVFAAEMKRFNFRFENREYQELQGLTLEYEPGYLAAIEKRFEGHGDRGPDVHRAVMEDISHPISRYLSSRESRNITARRKKYKDMRMTLGRDAKGVAKFDLSSETEQAHEAEKKRQRDLHARRIAETPDIEKFIAAVTAKDTDIRKLVKEQVGGLTGDPLLLWQKREVFSMLGNKETPDASQLQPEARIDVALDEAKVQFEQQFKKAVKQVAIVAGPQIRGNLSRHAVDAPPSLGGTARQVVAASFVAPVVQWMRENYEDVAAYAGKFPDAVVVVDELALTGGLPKAHVYSAREAWKTLLKVGLKTGQPVSAPKTAAFRRAPKPVT